MDNIEILGIPFSQFIAGLAGVAGYLILALLIRRILYRRIYRVALSSKNKWDDVLVRAVMSPTLILILVSTGWLAGRIMSLPANWEQSIDQLIRVGTIFSLILFMDRLLCGAVELYQEQLAGMNISRSIARVVVRGAVGIVGGLIILDTLHISITPLLASLGVGGLAVGLALSGTLSNLIAGMQVIGDRPIRVGDFIRLESGEQGYVTEIGWRATKVRMLPNNTVIIPNSKIVDSVITNYYVPEQALAVLVQAGVHYDSDLEHVERVTIAVAKEIQQKVKGAIQDFDPFIRYHTFDNSSINFTVIMRAGEFVDGYLMKHEFIKALHARYNREGIVIPFPIRTLDLPPDLLKKLGSESK